MNRVVAVLLGTLVAAALLATTSPTFALYSSQRTATMSVSATTLSATQLTGYTISCIGSGPSRAPTVTLTWAGLAGVSGWTLARADKPPGGSGKDPDFAVQRSFAGSATSGTDDHNLKKNSTYLYRISAKAGSWTGPPSPVLEVPIGNVC